MTQYLKPIPAPDHLTEPFWKGLKQNKLLAQKCQECGALQFFPQSMCSKCLSERLEWVALSGKGRVYSYTVIYRPPSDIFLADVPYTVAIVELEKGIRMMSNIIGIEPQDMKINIAVEIVFEEITHAITLPKFRPVKA